MLFVCWPLRLPDVVNQISPHTSEGISGWLTCHNPSFSELGQVRKHVDMFCIEVVGLDNHLHQFTSIAHFCTVSHWKGIYLYFYLVKIHFFYYRIITTSWSCLNMSISSFDKGTKSARSAVHWSSCARLCDVLSSTVHAAWSSVAFSVMYSHHWYILT